MTYGAPLVPLQKIFLSGGHQSSESTIVIWWLESDLHHCMGRHLSVWHFVTISNYWYTTYHKIKASLSPKVHLSSAVSLRSAEVALRRLFTHSENLNQEFC